MTKQVLLQLRMKPFRMIAVKRILVLFLWFSAVSTALADWDSYLGVDKNNSAREGFAFSNWTLLSSALDWPDEKIEAALVASCNEQGEKSLYVRMLPQYPADSGEQRLDIVEGEIQWDSSKAYGVPFIYNESLNALYLVAGLEDTLSMIRQGNKVTIQIPWQGGNQAVFEFSLEGSSRALESAFEYCVIDLKTSQNVTNRP